MSWKQTQTQTQDAAYDSVEAIMTFMNEWASTHQPGLDEGSSRKIPSLPNLTLNLSEVSS